MTHLKITTAGAIALVHEIAGLAVGLGVLNGSTQGYAVAGAVSAVNAGGLIANAIHHLASRSVDPAQVEAKAIALARDEISTVDFNALVHTAVDAQSLPDLEAKIQTAARDELQRLLGELAQPAPAPAPAQPAPAPAA